MPFEPEQGTREIVDAITSTPSFADGKASEDIQLWENLPPAFLGVREGYASLVIPPMAVPIGRLDDIKNEDGDVTPKTKVRIRRIVNELKDYREETIIENGNINQEALQRCAGTREPFLMSFRDKDTDTQQHIGLVMIHGISRGGEDGPLLHYQKKQGFIWLEQFIYLNKFPKTGSLTLVRMPELVKED